MPDPRAEAALHLLARDLTEAGVARALAAGLPQIEDGRLADRLAAAGGRLLGGGFGPLPPRLVALGAGNPAPLVTTNAPDDAFSGPAVGVVGTRRATGAGLEIAAELGGYLARAGVTVVSGLARGIDAAAHRGVVAEGGRGIAVLGSGLDVVYPRRHTALAGDLRQLGGGLVSQYAPGAEPFPWRFPRRNRLLAALADVVVVVEAHVTGGALITADEAAQLGREVMAVPGSPLVPASAGTNRLLREGATPLIEFSDVLDALGWGRPQSEPLWSDAEPADPLARQILELLTADPVPLDRLVRAVRREGRLVSAAVARLELAGLASRERGGVRRRGKGRA